MKGGDEPWLKKVERKQNLVRRSQLKNVDLVLRESPWLAIDCESTGLNSYKQDKFFSIAVANESESYYFNFIPYPGLDSEFVLELQDFQSLGFIYDEKTWVLHNAKFDLSLLRKVTNLPGQIHDTMVIERLLNNDELKYSLDAVSQKYGFKKDDAVDKFIEENHYWEWENIPGKKNRKKRLFYNLVPYPIMSEYAMNDAWITGQIYLKQLEKIKEVAKLYSSRVKFSDVVEMEKQLTKVVFDIEKVGVQIDREYCERKIRDNLERASEYARTYQGITGLAFVDSNKRHSEAFTREGVSYPKTTKGNPSFTDDVLWAFTTHDRGRISETAKIILGFRECNKRASTFFSSFLHYSDSEGIVHPNFKQAGTASGRFSCTDPNLQQVPKADESEDSKEVKRAFIPRPGYCFVECDYKQMEYVLMLDYAGETALIDRVKAGEDIHQATANMVGVTRKEAKTLNFAILYGAGSGKIAEMLSISQEKAASFKQKYFSALPNVEKFISKVTHTAQTRGWIFNWLGRRYVFQHDFCYKAPNYLIQGSGADVCKVAMLSLHKFLSNKKSRMVLQVHDAILFEVHETELEIVPELMNLMREPYKGNHLSLDVSVEHSWKSWGDLTKGLPLIESKSVEGAGVSL